MPLCSLPLFVHRPRPFCPFILLFARTPLLPRLLHHSCLTHPHPYDPCPFLLLRSSPLVFPYSSLLFLKFPPPPKGSSSPPASGYSLTPGRATSLSQPRGSAGYAASARSERSASGLESEGSRGVLPLLGSPRARCSLGEHGRFRSPSRAGAGLTAAPARRTPPSAPPAPQPRRSLQPFPPAAPAAPWRRARAARVLAPSRPQHGRPAWTPCPGNQDAPGPAQRPRGMERGRGPAGWCPNSWTCFPKAAPKFLSRDLGTTSSSLFGV